jgi:hypothetical protein
VRSRSRVRVSEHTPCCRRVVDRQRLRSPAKGSLNERRSRAERAAASRDLNHQPRLHFVVVSEPGTTPSATIYLIHPAWSGRALFEKRTSSIVRDKIGNDKVSVGDPLTTTWLEGLRARPTELPSTRRVVALIAGTRLTAATSRLATPLRDAAAEATLALLYAPDVMRTVIGVGLVMPVWSQSRQP